MAEVALLGTGRMGAAMALKLADAGHRVTVWNRTESSARALVASAGDRAMTLATTPADAVRGRDAVLSVLADGAATCQVLLDTSVLDSLSPESVVCDLATSGVAAARKLAEGLGSCGVRFVDAPVSGSVPAVQGGTLLVMAGGSVEAVKAASTVLQAFSRRIIHVGEAGAGQVMKLAVNLVVHDLNAALSEALVLAESAGISKDAAYDVLQDSVVGAPFVIYKRAAFLDPATPVAMSLDLVLKDLGLVTGLAADVGAPVTVTQAALDVVLEAGRSGYGAQDMASLSRAITPDPAS
jgi:3-hydroxyisobutyrate dehydrogenase-like beta-hydroxyacid dehydrogenase